MASDSKEAEGIDDHVYWGEEEMPPSFLQALGRVVVNFAHLEHLLALFCAVRLELPHPVGEIITADLSFKQRVNLARSFVDASEDRATERGKFKALVKRLLQLEEDRNRVVHSYYGASKAGIVLRKKVTIRARSGYVAVEDEVSDTSVNDLAHRLASAGRDIGRLISIFQPRAVMRRGTSNER